ncbi:ABC transporter permease [Marseilla massiliensis]|uniref:ABC transporter permease n=1 Tax=Marseilla massiliensis TaxID=1841864 RepID=UPI001FA5EFFE|nr:FtsX-like permease family protein [Marseilla massiliensis]MCL1609183.1 ABC transporter permease [Marseilla massiliensis]HIV83963.1 ABC transporter permease [Candidatus Prevotella intestinigallinarum]
MNLPLFLARRIYKDKGDKYKVSRPAIRIATIGVAIGLAVMVVTVSVVLGFKHTIRDKVVGFGSHIQVENFLALQSTDPYPICVDDSLMRVLRSTDGVKHVERFALTQGILKTDSDFLGMTFKGVGPEYDFTFIRQNLVAGDIPEFSDQSSHYKLLVSQMTADKLKLAVGDKVYAYFISNNDVRARRFTVSGIYQTNLTLFDQSLCFTDLYTAVRLNNWLDGQCTGAEITVADFGRLEETAANVVERVNRTPDKYGDILTSQTIDEAYPQIFSWLDLLDINVWIILALMVCVAGFTMISGLLIIILERTQMIGTLKALGARNSTVRHTFLWFAAFIIGRGLLFGNIIGIGIVLVQEYTGVVSLDPTSYYVSTAPMELNVPFIVLLNVATLLISLFVLIAPSYLISHIHPAKSMRYE